MTQWWEPLVALAGAAFLTSPIWYPLWCADRAARAWADMHATPRDPGNEPDDPDEPDW